MADTMIKNFFTVIIFFSALSFGCRNFNKDGALSDLNSMELKFKPGSGLITRVADAGAGDYASKLWTWEKWQSRELFRAQLFGAGWVYGHDAARHLSHYFGNTGEELNVDAKRFFQECPGAQRLFLKWLRSAFDYVESLPEGQHEFSLTGNDLGECKKDESINWYYATAGFNVYFRGLAYIDKRVTPGWRTLTFTAQYYDRYNWDVGDSFVVNNKKTLESNMGEFHLMGLAKEYDLFGEYMENFTWRDGQSFEVLLKK